MTTTTRASLENPTASDVQLAPPVQVSVQDLADSVVVLTPGRSLLVSHHDATAWRASAQDCSVVIIDTPTQAAAGGATDKTHTFSVCSLTAAAPGRTRGHLVGANGQRHPFEVIVLARQPNAQCAALAAAQALRQPRARSRSSWAVRCRRVLRPLGRPGAAVIANG